MSSVLILAAILGGTAYVVYRWRSASIERQKRLVRQQRRREQEEAWEQMLTQSRAAAPPTQG